MLNICVHYYNIIQNSFTPLKITVLCALPMYSILTPPPSLATTFPESHTTGAMLYAVCCFFTVAFFHLVMVHLIKIHPYLFVAR